MNERLVQFQTDDGNIGVAILADDTQSLYVLDIEHGTYGLAIEAISQGKTLRTLIAERTDT